MNKAWVAPNASLIGDVMVSNYATIWYNCTLRAEYNPIRIGHFSSIGDACTMFTAHSLPQGIAASINIGKNVTIEHNVNLHSCIIDDDVVVGHNSVIMQGARLERGCQILPNSIVGPGRLIPAGQMWGGNQVKFVKDLSAEEQLENYTKSYSAGASEFTSKLSMWPRSFEEGDLKDD